MKDMKCYKKIVVIPRFYSAIFFSMLQEISEIEKKVQKKLSTVVEAPASTINDVGGEP